MQIMHQCAHIAQIEGNEIIDENGHYADIHQYDDNSGYYAICPKCGETIIIH